MNIEIHQPELEAIINRRMASGLFHNVEDILMAALKSQPEENSGEGSLDLETGTGELLIAAMQASPHKDISIEPSRPHLPVRDVIL